ncbi:interleukin-13 receptor subunit alpha-1-like [Mustelus asterias]
MLFALSSLILTIPWTIAADGAALTSSEGKDNHTPAIANLSCFFHNTSQMNCTWDIDGQAEPDAQYTLSYSNERNHREIGCSSHSCHVQNFELFIFRNVKICLTQSSQNPAKRQCIVILPVTYYKSNPPVKVKVNDTEVEWEPPEGHHPSPDFYYQVEITDRSNNVKMTEGMKLTKWTIENCKKRYSVKVRAKVLNHITDSLWSDWSQAVNIEPKKDFTLLLVIVPIITFGALLLLMMFICTRYKLLENLCQPIPDPEKKFKGLFDNYHGNFEEWIRVKPFVTNLPEKYIAVTVED